MAEASASYVDHTFLNVSWIEGLEKFGSTAKDVPPFYFLRDKERKDYFMPPVYENGLKSYHYSKHWLYAPNDHWEKRMRHLPRSTQIKWFEHVIQCYDPNPSHLTQLKHLIEMADKGSKIVTIMSETYYKSGMTEVGHVFCAVWHKHEKGVDIITHDVNSQIRPAMLDFFWKNFKEHNLVMTDDERKFIYQHCKEKCSDGTRLDKNSCVFMTHLAAELELRNIMPKDRLITVNMQKGYAVFLKPESERLREAALIAMKLLKERMKKIAESNSPRNEIAFYILGQRYQVNNNFYGSKIPNSSNLIPLLMNYNNHFFVGNEEKENKHLKKAINQIELEYRWEQIGYVR